MFREVCELLHWPKKLQDREPFDAALQLQCPLCVCIGTVSGHEECELKGFPLDTLLRQSALHFI